MSKVHFITDGSNKTKVIAVQNALKKAPLSDIYFDAFKCEQKDYKPLSRDEVFSALGERTENLLSEYKCPLKDSLVYAISIQKGVNVKDTEDKLRLICGVIITSEDGQKSCIALSSIILPEEIRSLVLGKGMDLYDAYGEVYGEDIKAKKMSLYEKLTGKSEESWIEETVLKALIF